MRRLKSEREAVVAATSVVALAEYSESKRTEVYSTTDFNKVDGAAAVEVLGRNNQTGLAVGLRNFF